MGFSQREALDTGASAEDENPKLVWTSVAGFPGPWPCMFPISHCESSLCHGDWWHSAVLRYPSIFVPVYLPQGVP